MEPGPSGTSKASAQISGQSDTDITAEFLQPLLTPDNVANLVRTDAGCFPQGREEAFLVLFPPSLYTAQLFQMALVPAHLSVLGVGRVWTVGPLNLGWTFSLILTPLGDPLSPPPNSPSLDSLSPHSNAPPAPFEGRVD